MIVFWRGSAKTPVGTLFFTVNESTDTLIKASFRDNSDSSVAVRSRSHIHTACSQYFDGDLGAFNALSVEQLGSEFTHDIYAHMRQIPPGAVESYGGLAARAGHPGAARAVGSACSRNAIVLVVPCHRVVAAQGLGGYEYGIDIKRALLEHEGYGGFK